MDAVTHLGLWFFNEWLDHVCHSAQQQLFSFGKYWAADYYGTHYWDKDRNDNGWYEIWMDSHRWLVDKFLYARKHYSYGNQCSYFDPPSIGWTRLGDKDHLRAMAVLLSNGPGGSKESVLKLLYLALRNIAKKWTMPIRDWKAALNRFAIEFPDRFPQ